MRFGLIIPLLVLIFAVLELVVVLSLSGKRKRLEERVLANMTRTRSGVRPDAAQPGNDVRIRRPAAAGWRIARRLLNIPVDLPLAHVISPVWILVAVTLIASLTAWGSHFLVPWWFAALATAVVWVFLARTIFGWELEQYRSRLLRQLPDTIHLVISATRAGLPVSENLFRTVVQEMPRPTSAEFARVVDEMSLGIAADQALLSLHRRTEVTEYAIFAVTVGVQARSGGRLAETITNLADTVRDRIMIKGKARALSTEARTAAIIMAVLPIISGTVLELSRPGYLKPLFEDPRGQTMVVIGLVTLAMGVITMRQLIAGATRD